MTKPEKWEKIIKGLEQCQGECLEPSDGKCPYYPETHGDRCFHALLSDVLTLLKALNAFKSYFDSLYGQGLEVANWHMNGATEPFDNFYDSAMEEYNNA